MVVTLSARRDFVDGSSLAFKEQEHRNQRSFQKGGT